MNFKKILGFIVVFIGIGLIWMALIGWQGHKIFQEALSSVDQTLEPAFTHTPPLINTATPTPPWQAEPIVPTAPPPSLPHSAPQETQFPRSTITPLPSLISSNALKRFGIGVPYPPLRIEVAQKLGLGWYLAWRVLENPVQSDKLEFWQMIRVSEDGFRPDRQTIERAALANPGATWLIGNEPDVIWQDNITPTKYAELYHQLYYFLKEIDPTCQVAIGGVTQPTPLRLQYLEIALSSYQARYREEIPIDIWNIHNFILREERDSWGVDIPPGLEADQGILYEVDEHDNLDIFKSQIISFRRWMADHGQRNKPLIVSEYGILMPEDYGFDPERVQRFLYSTYEFMLNEADPSIGYPADDNRLVQRWAWYSLSDDRYSTGNFIDLNTGKLTRLGQAHQSFISQVPQ